MSAVPLSRVADINPSGPTDGGIAPDDLLDFIPMASVSEDGYVQVTERRRYSDVAKGFTAFRNNDVLIAKITPCFENNKIAIARINSDYAFGSTEFHVVRCSTELDPNYLVRFLRQERVRRAGEQRMTGSAGQRRVPKTFLDDLEVPLPLLGEQKRIAAILDQADAVRRLRRRSIERLGAFERALFHEIFGDPRLNPKKLPRAPLGELIKVSSGEGLTSADQNGGIYPVYGGNGINGWHDEHLVSAGTIVIGRVGVYCGAVHVTDRAAWVTDNALIVKQLTDGLSTAYLAAALKYANLNQYAGRSSQPLVSGNRIYPVEILVPSTEDQARFQTLISEQAWQLKALSEHQSVLEGLFASLNQRAFRGEL